MEIINTSGKRLLGIDFGKKRIGLAFSDEFHITIRPIETLLYQEPDFWNRFFAIIEKENIGAIVIGVPYR